MVGVGCVVMAVVHVVYVVVMLHSFVTTVFSVFVVVVSGMNAGIFAAFKDAVIINVASVYRVVMSIMNIVGVRGVLYRLVTTFGTVNVVVSHVLGMGHVCYDGRRNRRGRFGNRGSLGFLFRAGATGQG